MKRLGILALISLAACVQADITYRVDVQPDKNNLHVTIHLPNTARGSKLQIPNWGPGGYVVRDGSRNVHNLKATDDKGQTLAIESAVVMDHKAYQDGTEHKFVDNPITTWTVAPAKETNVEYDIDSRLTDGAMHWGGPGTYLYEISRRKEKCVLSAHVPTGWQVFTGLDELPKQDAFLYQRARMLVGTGSLDAGVEVVFAAKDYDTFADNPVTVGGADGLIVDTYTTLGKPHYIVMRGAAKSKVDRAKLLKACKFVSDAENDFFGNKPPYNKYIWHFAVNDAADGAGGLEHLSSTEISLAAGVGPRAVSVLAHEFFHLWNVKRIRSFPLGPFDYTKLPDTGALWWLEGVTDYYAYTLLHRYGWTDDASYFATATSNLQIVLRNAAHTDVGPNEASMRVAEMSGGHGNSNGYRISYYNLGWLAGMCLDINLRARTGSKRSLDDIEHALWNLCKNGKPGFQEGEIRAQYVKFGGDGAVYDRIVMQPNMPVDEALALVGMHAVTSQESYVDLGFTWGGGPGSSTLNVISVRGPAEGKLQLGDVILQVDGTVIKGDTGRERTAAIVAATRGVVAGTSIKLMIKRGDVTLYQDITPVTATRPVFKIEAMANQTPEQKKVADGWLAKRPLP